MKESVQPTHLKDLGNSLSGIWACGSGRRQHKLSYLTKLLLGSSVSPDCKFGWGLI